MTHETCRLCLSSDFEEKHEIFQRVTNGVSLSIKIMLCSSLTISEDDLLPKFICNRCFNIIDVFYHFRELCIQNYRKLVNCMNENKADMVEVKEPAETERVVHLFIRNGQSVNMDSVPSTRSENEPVDAMQLLKAYQCTNCNFISETIEDIEKHVCQDAENKNNELINNQYQCSYCDRQYKSKSQVTLHEKVHKGTQPHKCSHCTKSFLRPSDKVKHERTHTGERPYSCDICDKSFKQIAGLIVHERYHTGQRPYKCSTCSRSFTQDGTLKKHKKVHAGGKKPFVCDFKSCGRGFTNKEECDLHVEFHFSEKPHTCLTCSLNFKKPAELQSHNKMCCKADYMYNCLKCQKDFVSTVQFKPHVHCPICDSAFDKKTVLEKHLSVSHHDVELEVERN